MNYLTKPDGSKFTEDDILLLILSEFSEVLEGAELIKEELWRVNGKWQYRKIIFKYQDKFYAIDDSRSGSDFTDWYHQYSQPYEVEKVENSSSN